MASNIEIDWVVIRVQVFKRLGAVLVGLAVAGALLYLGYRLLNPEPPVLARQAIDRAQRAEDIVAKAEIPDVWANDLAQAAELLADARAAYAQERWMEAINQASDAAERYEFFTPGGGGIPGVGKVESLHGRVTVQRFGTGQWTAARTGMPVYNGDFVRTASDGRAEVILADGTLYRVNPNSMLEVHLQRKAKTTEGEVKVRVGDVNIATGAQQTKVNTDSSDTVVARDSRVAVRVDKDDKRTIVGVAAGGAQVTGSTGETVDLVEKEQVGVKDTGELTEKSIIPDPPMPVAPESHEVFDRDSEAEIRLAWDPGTAQGQFHLQVSRSKEFLPGYLDIDRDDLASEVARLRPVLPGTYYWRVAVVDDQDLRSEWSRVRRFQIVSSKGESYGDDTTAPEIVLTKAQQFGENFIVEGITEPGATVTVNGESVDVSGDGSFQKTVQVSSDGWNEILIASVDAAGNRAETSERVFVEVF